MPAQPPADGPSLAEIPLFSGLNPVAMKELQEKADYSVQEAGTVFATQGEFTGRFHVVLSGGVSAYRTERDGAARILDTLGPGDWFGEMSALSNQPSAATLKADTTCVLLSIEAPTFKSLYLRGPDFKKRVDAKYRERSLAAHLRLAPLFRGLSDEALAALRRDVAFESFPEGATLARAGEEAKAVYLVRGGAVKCVRRAPGGQEEILAYYMTNSSFGERALNREDRRWAGDYVTLAPTDLLVVTQEVLQRHFGDDSRSMTVLREAAERIFEEHSGGAVPSEREARRAEQVGSEEMEFMVRRQSVKGGEALVIDLEKCVRCNACVESCVAVHEDGIPRLSKKGSRVTFEENGTHHRYNLATSCYNCQIPGCMLSCNFGAIRRDAQGLIRFDYENCVGCAMCVSACPYDVIRLTDPSGSERQDRSLWEAIPLLGKLLGRKKEAPPEPEGPVLNAQGLPVQAKAIKCDLCAGLPFEACVYNCPCSAIQRVNPEALFRKKRAESRGTFSYTHDG